MDKRAIIIVLDSVGIGASPDAGEFGDEGAHTLGNIYKERGRLALPNLYGLGLASIADARLPGIPERSRGSFGRAAEVARGKDTTSGHWEICGIVMDKPFRTYPLGFPDALIAEFSHRIGRGVLGNRVASGTAIIDELGDEHVRTGKPIVYTSADSVFQIAAHEDVIPLEKLYWMCQEARGMLVGEHLVGRVIARPFIGASGHYTRTENRKDYAIAPPCEGILDGLLSGGYQTISIGKIADIFFNRGITKSIHTGNNSDGIEAIVRAVASGEGSLIFANLVDFDMLYGHRNDVEGYAKALEQFDHELPRILEGLGRDDLLIITADHGCDPTTPGTDHTREYIPIVAYAPSLEGGVDIGTRTSFSDIGSTAYEHITGRPWAIGASFLSLLR